MFSPTPSFDEEDAHLPTVAELKRAQAVHARAAKQKKRLPGSSATVDLLTRNSPQSGGRRHRESAQWQDRGKQEAAHKIFVRGHCRIHTGCCQIGRRRSVVVDQVVE